MFDNQVDAQSYAKRLWCAECDGAVEAHLAGPRTWVARCTFSRGAHTLRPKGKNAVQHYLETGEGDAITRQRAERWLLKKEQEQEEALELAESQAIEGKSNDTLRELLERADIKQAIAEALPKQLNAERFMRLALTAVRKNPALAECTPASFAGALLQAAAVGLEPETPLHHCYLIPFKDNKKGVSECTLVLGYQGMMDLARRSGQVTIISADVVYKGDTFEWEQGLNPSIRHFKRAEPITRFDQRSRRTLFTGDNVTHAYAVATLKGEKQSVVLTRKELDSLRSHSRAASDGPWVNHTEEMFKKTALRRLCKMLPMSPEIMGAIATEEEATMRVIESTGEIIGPEEPSIPPPPLDDCPEHGTPWRRGDQGGLFHSMGRGSQSCTPSRLLTAAAAEHRQWEKGTLDDYARESFDKTLSHLETDEVLAAYTFIIGDDSGEETPPDDLEVNSE